MSQPHTPMRFQIRADAYFVKTADGVWLRNNHGSFTITGQAAYPLVRFLFAGLHGGASIAELCSKVSDEQKKIIEGVIHRLHEKGFIQPLSEPEAVPDWAQTLYGDKLRFIAQQHDAPFGRFLSFRRRTLVCRGEGAVLRAVVVALAEYGAGHVIVAPTSPDLAERKALSALLRAVEERDQQVTFHVDENSAQPAVIGEPQHCTLWALALPEHQAGSSLQPAAGESVAAVYPAADVLVVSSPLTADSPVCFECIQHTLPPSPASAAPVPPVVSAMAANQLVYGLFCQCTGLREEADNPVRTIAVSTLTMRVHRVHPHPRCSRHAAGLPEKLPVLQTGRSVRSDLPSALDEPDLVRAQDEIAALSARLCDPRTGPLLHLGEGEHAQVPLAVSECVVRTLTREGTATGEMLLCAALSTREARNQVVLLALEQFGRSRLQGAVPPGRRSPLALGAGWSLDEAAYRSLHYATLAWTPKNPAADSAELRASESAEYLKRIIDDRAAGLTQLTTTLSPTGLFVATAAVQSGRVGHGAGISPPHALLNALMDLASYLVGPTAPLPALQPALLMAPVPKWADALAAAAGNRDDRVPLEFYDMSSLLPFARDQAYLVSVELAHEQDRVDLARGQ